MRRVDPRKYRISFRLNVHAGYFEARGLVDYFRIYVGAATNHNGRGAPPQRVTLGYLRCGVDAGRHHDAGGGEFGSCVTAMVVRFFRG